MVAVGSLGVLFSIPGQTMGVSVFTDHLIKALGLTRVRLSTAYMLGTLGSAFLMTRAGRLTDRLGVRTVAAFSALALAAVLVFFSQIDRVSGSVATIFGGTAFVTVVVAFVAVTVGFLGIRFFGQGVLTLASRTMVMRWFNQRRGRIAGWFGVTVSAGFSYAPRVYQSLIDANGWRGAWLVLALSLVLIAIPMALVFYRDSPERCGLKMEQNLRPLKIHKSRHDRQGPDATLVEARRDPRYWAYGFLLAWWALFSTAFTFHVVDIFAVRGVGAAAAVAIFLPISIVSVVSNFVGSWASDAIDLPPIYFLATLGFAVVAFSMLDPGASWSRVVLVAGYGLGGGMWSVLSNVVWPRLYGREHLGEISGSVMTFMVGGSALGPWLFSLLRSDETGYLPAGIFGLAGTATAAILGLIAFREQRQRRKGALRETS